MTGRFTYFSGEKWTTKIIEGKVEVCGNPSTPEYILREKDEVSFISDTISEPEVDSTFEIVYEDEFLFAVNKSGNLPVHPAGRYRNGNLLKILESNSIDPIYISNRIDRETSGLVLFSRSKDIARRINQLFAQRQIQKTYIVYTSGGFPDTLSAIGRMEKDAASLIRKKLKFIPDTGAETGKSDYCETVFRKIGTLSGISKVFAFPKT
ncbi:MAG: RluA family pseudouridine synthase, partial [Leptospira sp.]|nr:RluA family pseudouridine synthase [Leptospira sp.]